MSSLRCRLDVVQTTMYRDSERLIQGMRKQPSGVKPIAHRSPCAPNSLVSSSKTLSMAIAGQYSVETDSHSIPATMHAAVYRGVNDVRLETVPVPSIAAGEMLVRVHSCGVCGTDLKNISTGSNSAPRIFGQETSGV